MVRIHFDVVLGEKVVRRTFGLYRERDRARDNEEVTGEWQ
jgi:hypothetical protein